MMFFSCEIRRPHRLCDEGAHFQGDGGSFAQVLSSVCPRHVLKTGLEACISFFLENKQTSIFPETKISKRNKHKVMCEINTQNMIKFFRSPPSSVKRAAML